MAKPAQAPPPIFSEPEETIRAELFSVERLEQHAESLAAAQLVVTDPEEGRPLIPRVLENGRVLLEYYRATARAIQHEQAITPAAEWFVDNFYIVEEQLREIRDDLPAGFYRKLPKLASGHLEGFPRVFGVAWAFVAHNDSRFDPEVLRRFVSAYQRVQPLTIGELWAVAITLRIVLVENLRRVAERIVRSRNARVEADILADRVLGTAGQTAVSPAAVLRRFENKPLERSFAVQLVQRLRDLDPKVGPILVWLDERLAAQGTTADEIVRAEHQEQAAMSVTVRNIITSMRLTSAFDWEAFFESVSLVDEILRSGSNFGDMDFATRDYYRHAIEDLSRGSSHSEIEVAQRAVQRAKRARAELHNDGQPPDERKADPGYYLISRGRLDFERELGFQIRLAARRAASICARRRTGVFGHDRINDRADPGAAFGACAGTGSERTPPGAARFAGFGARFGFSHRVNQSRGGRPTRTADFASAGTARWRSGGIAHHHRGSHSVDFPGCDQGTSRAPGDSLPRERGWRSPLRAAHRLDGRCHGEPAR